MAPCLEEGPFRILAGLTDAELVERFHQGQAQAADVLLRRYRRLARAKARGYFLVGADADDIEQEGMIGLYKAARDFRPDRQASFRAFAELCITRQVLSAIKTATRQKHQFLNTYVSLAGATGAQEGCQPARCVELLGACAADPADTVVSRECLAALRRALVELLSALEVEVLRLHVAGKSYQEIGEELGRHVKSIDNALQRIKRKLDVHLQAA
ncbi:MAG TPA: RNA polymerase sporulation sigma factor SigH [Acidimicrobiales bacterium]|nr:RNA polymerase sporulation sigma factor SigH [Acidimicrobiales bacterium]